MTERQEKERPSFDFVSKNPSGFVGIPEGSKPPEATAPLLKSDGRFEQMTVGLLPTFNTVGTNCPHVDTGVKSKDHCIIITG